MKRVLGLALVLFAASSLHGTRAAAQCGSSCQTLRDLETGQIVGYGCVDNPDAGTSCSATTRGCTIRTCGGGAMILDTKGAVLASAQLCGGRVRAIRTVAVVPSAPARVATLTDAGNRSPDPRLALRDEDGAGAMQ